MTILMGCRERRGPYLVPARRPAMTIGLAATRATSVGSESSTSLKVNVIAIDMDIFNNKNILNLGKDRDILNNISNLASLHIALGWQMCIHIQYTFAYMQ